MIYACLFIIKWFNPGMSGLGITQMAKFHESHFKGISGVLPISPISIFHPFYEISVSLYFAGVQGRSKIS